MVMQVAALDVLTMKGGFAPQAARAIGEVIDMEIARSRETLATSQQLSEECGSLKTEIGEVARSLRTEIKEVERSLSERIEEVNSSLTARIDGLETSLRTDIAAVNKRLDGMVTRPEFDAKFDAFRHEIDSKLEKLNSGIVRWVFVVGLGSWAMQAGTIAGLMKFFAPHTP